MCNYTYAHAAVIHNVALSLKADICLQSYPTRLFIFRTQTARPTRTFRRSLYTKWFSTNDKKTSLCMNLFQLPHERIFALAKFVPSIASVILIQLKRHSNIVDQPTQVKP